MSHIQRGRCGSIGMPCAPVAAVPRAQPIAPLTREPLKRCCKQLLHGPQRTCLSHRQAALEGLIVRFKTEHQQNPVAAAAAPRHAAPQQVQSLKVIGLGMRGISAVNRILKYGDISGAEFWALDSDKRVLGTCPPGARILEVSSGDDCNMDHGQLALIAGVDSVPAAPETPDGDAGAVFLLGSAFGSPGGAPMMLQLVRHLRRQGFFVAVALTRPFEFEGARKLEAADTLISTMQEVAHLVVVVEQSVLTRASTELTMAQASAIADNTLEYTVRSTLWALRSPEILMVSHGAFLWHGRDLRLIKRPLFPPMMSLLSCPGHGTLGRGQAAIPSSLLQHTSLASVLSTLAEDAVKAASESPFLDNKLESATAVLCVLRLPPSTLGLASGTNGNVPDNQKEYALRSAVQVAAMTVRDLVGRQCHDIVICPQISEELEREQQDLLGASQDGGSSGSGGGGERLQQLRLEASLLVLEAIEEAAGAETDATAADGGNSSTAPPAGAAATASRASADSPAAATAGVARDRTAAIIGSRSGAARAASFFSGPPVRSSGPATAPTPPTAAYGAASLRGPGAREGPGAHAAPTAASPAAAASNSQKMSRLAAMSALAGGSATAAHTLQGAGAAAGRASSSPAWRSVPQQAAVNGSAMATPRPGALRRQDQDVGAMHGGQAADGRPGASSPGRGGPTQIPRLADSVVVGSLVAQSLDLPPHAARWRHQQRPMPERAGKAALPAQQFFELPEVEEEFEEDAPSQGLGGLLPRLLGGREPPAAAATASGGVKNRVAGMLEKERNYR